ncbi:MAG: diaminopimelate epimerase [Armatimonadetes bacterium]|nr:diaminopimelate epimerase [Armatimonadota bacterium]
MEIPFTKLQALGNHFALVHEPSAPPFDPNVLAPSLCRHHFGVGADGLLVVSPSTVADVRMRYYDPDGSEDMCGNGLRCVARFVIARGLAPAEMRVETLSGVRECEALSATDIRAEMGEPIFETERLPAIADAARLLDYHVEVNGRTYPVTGVSFGTTHVVIIGHGRRGPHWDADSAALEVHPMFPGKTTVDWVEIVSRDHILMRPWERRLGETLACGTGACASAVATALHELTDRRVLVEMKGGKLLVEWGADNRVIATGAVQIVYEGTYYGAR